MKHKKKRRLEDTAPIYTEDIGTQGIKKSSITSGAGGQSSIHDLPLTKDEKTRRRKRMVRSNNGILSLVFLLMC
jgi:hypothetical protein